MFHALMEALPFVIAGLGAVFVVVCLLSWVILVFFARGGE